VNLPETACDILHTLLDRYEQPGRQQVVRVRLSLSEHPAYFSTEDSAPRHTTNNVLIRLADAGKLHLRWRKWEDGNWLEAVDLQIEQASSIYTLLGRGPRNEKDQALRHLLDAQEPSPGWHTAFLAWARAQIDMHRAVAPLDRDDSRLNADLLRALAALAGLSAPTLERTLSTRLFRNSKRLEALRGAIIRVLRRHDQEAPTFGEDDWALLRAHNLDRAPEYVPIAGPLALCAPTTDPDHCLAPAPVIELTPFQPSVALSAAMLRSVDVVTCNARILVTVENATSFNELLAVRPADLLAIYTGGFASPTVIQLVTAIRGARPTLPIVHWGDLDAGGLRILAHLRQHLRDIAPLAMNSAIFDAYQAFAQPLTPTDRSPRHAPRARRTSRLRGAD
jgi:hypothetical protein